MEGLEKHMHEEPHTCQRIQESADGRQVLPRVVDLSLLSAGGTAFRHGPVEPAQLHHASAALTSSRAPLSKGTSTPWSASSSRRRRASVASRACTLRSAKSAQ